MPLALVAAFGGDLQNIEQNTRIELPVWLAAVLNKRRMVAVDMPRGFGTRTRQALLADAMAVSLRERSPHCFHLCTRAAELSNRVEALELPRIARVALATRAIVTLDEAANSVGSDIAATRGKLTDFEIAIFERGYDFAKDKLEWRRRRSAPLRVSALEQGVAARRARAAALAAESAHTEPVARSSSSSSSSAAAAASAAVSATSQASLRFSEASSVGGAESEATTQAGVAGSRSQGFAAASSIEGDGETESEDEAWDGGGGGSAVMASLRSSEDAGLAESPSKRHR